jgi:lysophospholipase L1-like esterase
MNPLLFPRRTWGTLACWLAAVLSWLPAAQESPPVAPTARRILFLGDSITYSGQYVEYVEAFLRLRYPAWRGEILNLGLPSETVSGLSEAGHAGGQFPRPDLHERLDRVLAKTQPDLIVACYGMNDGIYLPFSTDRFQKFQDGIRRLRAKAATAGAQVLHLTPPTFDPVAGKKVTPPETDYNGVLDRYSGWLLAQRADGWVVVDVHGPMNRHLAERRKQDPAYRLAGDGVHPNDTGHWLMALPVMLHFGASADDARSESPKAMLGAYTNGPELLKLVQERQRLLKDAWLTDAGHKRPGMNKGLPLPEAQKRAAALDERIRTLARPTGETDSRAPAAFPGKQSAWHGFDRHDFEVGARTASVIVPKQPLPGRLWAWKGEFLDAFPAAEIALLNQGVHLVYLSVPDLLGSPEAVKHWNVCHRELTGKYGFAPKPALIALSRAGLYCYNWATANPEKVACIYADAAVCDFKSWPGGKGKGKGSTRDWQLVLDRYGFKSEAEALAYRGNPIDSLEPLAKARVPLLHVYGDADDVVPWEENTGIVAEHYKKLGGDITLIAKPGVGHHPHGLSDPAPIVQFILRHMAK